MKIGHILFYLALNIRNLHPIFTPEETLCTDCTISYNGLPKTNVDFFDLEKC